MINTRLFEMPTEKTLFAIQANNYLLRMFGELSN
jgi:hypothetical protein